MVVNIDNMIDRQQCPALMFCTVATECYPPREREHLCYLCWKKYCQDNDIMIGYDKAE